jgi:hypothetical protein
MDGRKDHQAHERTRGAADAVAVCPPGAGERTESVLCVLAGSSGGDA